MSAVRREVSAVWSAYQDSRYGYALSRLPGLLVDAQLAALNQSGQVDRQALVSLALAYHSAAALLTKLGEVDMAWLAADRGLAAAREADAPVVVGSLFRSVIHALQSAGRHSEAVDLVPIAASYLKSRTRHAEPAAVSIYGTLFLAGAMAAARARDRSTVVAYLAEAESSAEILGSDGNHMWTSFGPTNVAIHRVATSAELDDVQVAIELGVGLNTISLPTERRVRHALEVARALSRRNRQDEVLGMLLDAERIAPEQVRNHFMSRQLVHVLIRGQRGRPSPELAGLATRLGALT